MLLHFPIPVSYTHLRFSWKDIPQTGLGTKDFIAPDSLDFRQSRTFRIGQYWELKRAIIESIVAFSKKTDAILHSAIMVNIALADKQRILSSGILNPFLALIYRTLCLTPFIPDFL